VDNRAESVDNGTRLWTDRPRGGRWPTRRMCVGAGSMEGRRWTKRRCPPDVHRTRPIRPPAVHRRATVVHRAAPHGHAGPSTTSTAWWRWWRS